MAAGVQVSAGAELFGLDITVFGDLDIKLD